jgi:HEPN domain-containing protein
MKRATAGWVRKAEHDFRGAVGLRGQRPPLHDLVCFHCQQCAEKYLKALLEEQGLVVHKTHDLPRLLAELLPYYPSLGRLRRGLAILTDYAVDVRYPGDTPTKRQAESAVRWAEKCRTAVRGLLGLPI